MVENVQEMRLILKKKNNSARTSLACQNLNAVYRWCLTASPLLNKLEDLFPYLRFTRANFATTWKVFQRYFCGEFYLTPLVRDTELTLTLGKTQTHQIAMLALPQFYLTL